MFHSARRRKRTFRIRPRPFGRRRRHFPKSNVRLQLDRFVSRLYADSRTFNNNNNTYRTTFGNTLFSPPSAYGAAAAFYSDDHCGGPGERRALAD